MKTKALVYLLTISGLMMGCTPSADSPKGFSLPDGDAQVGYQLFGELGCNSCHQMHDSKLPFLGEDEPIILGGEVTRVKTYGELVTSVINPSHKINPNAEEGVHRFDDVSRMEYTNLNQHMTIQELIDVIAFLQNEYKVVPPKTNYRPYR